MLDIVWTACPVLWFSEVPRQGTALTSDMRIDDPAVSFQDWSTSILAPRGPIRPASSTYTMIISAFLLVCSCLFFFPLAASPSARDPIWQRGHVLFRSTWPKANHHAHGNHHPPSQIGSDFGFFSCFCVASANYLDTTTPPNRAELVPHVHSGSTSPTQFLRHRSKSRRPLETADRWRHRPLVSTPGFFPTWPPASGSAKFIGQLAGLGRQRGCPVPSSIGHANIR